MLSSGLEHSGGHTSRQPDNAFSMPAFMPTLPTRRMLPSLTQRSKFHGHEGKIRCGLYTRRSKVGSSGCYVWMKKAHSFEQSPPSAKGFKPLGQRRPGLEDMRTRGGRTRVIRQHSSTSSAKMRTRRSMGSLKLESKRDHTRNHHRTSKSMSFDQTNFEERPVRSRGGLLKSSASLSSFASSSPWNKHKRIQSSRDYRSSRKMRAPRKPGHGSAEEAEHYSSGTTTMRSRIAETPQTSVVTFSRTNRVGATMITTAPRVKAYPGRYGAQIGKRNMKTMDLDETSAQELHDLALELVAEQPDSVQRAGAPVAPAARELETSL
uniref:Uncharacterized protein n=1 Tax=Lotharella globosa TaxID=91324 RepID=A0A7S3YYG6_9EUKA|mmetsp:Transcript_6330/g.12601  ORF Transcript_6330/g.12601 Transcript_6330/m.12601 type:complete len:321 (-) Transcript_6330:262-1224(-)|eukprot:CAMPEP_0167814280 /NCGR_PEP_ID=MMETSP0112_2-20121227/2334_1 /TAXON_ID=91324 /ORGANISM="Lotharella globosa, Strain CCCM811" /LENGTH=320 /DNA_ID=CAMNT_0007713481 /DNA_START=36 /DNA_END=998 /DNA_ORIENTATION=+